MSYTNLVYLYKFPPIQIDFSLHKGNSFMQTLVMLTSRNKWPVLGQSAVEQNIHSHEIKNPYLKNSSISKSWDKQGENHGVMNSCDLEPRPLWSPLIANSYHVTVFTRIWYRLVQLLTQHSWLSKKSWVNKNYLYTISDLKIFIVL